MLLKFKHPMLTEILLGITLLIVAQVISVAYFSGESAEQLTEQVNQELAANNQRIESTLKNTQSSLQQQAQQQAQQASDDLAEQLSAKLEQQLSLLQQSQLEQIRLAAENFASLLASSSPAAIWDKDVPALTKLVQAAHADPDVLFAVFFDMQGKYLTRHLERKNPKVKELLKTGEGRKSIFKVLDAASKDKTVLVIETMINPKGADIGKLVLGVDLSRFLATQQQLAEQSDAIIEQTQALSLTMIEGQAQTANTYIEQIVSEIHQANDRAISQLDGALSKEASALQGTITLLLGISGLILLLSLAAFFIYRILRPISQLSQSLAELADHGGDLSQRLPIKRLDEVGRMAEAINQFLQATRELIQSANVNCDATNAKIVSLGEAAQQAQITVAEQQQQRSAIYSAQPIHQPTYRAGRTGQPGSTRL